MKVTSLYEKCIDAKDISEDGNSLNIMHRKTDEVMNLKIENFTYLECVTLHLAFWGIFFFYWLKTPATKI